MVNTSALMGLCTVYCPFQSGRVSNIMHAQVDLEYHARDRDFWADIASAARDTEFLIAL
jgi:hypothetical protein